MPDDPSLHLSLICWDDARHVIFVSAHMLRSMQCAPVCFIRDPERPFNICGAPIYAVQHMGEPIRYVGRPPHEGWQKWANCAS